MPRSTGNYYDGTIVIQTSWSLNFRGSWEDIQPRIPLRPLNKNKLSLEFAQEEASYWNLCISARYQEIPHWPSFSPYNLQKKGAETKEKEIHHATIVENMDDLVAKMDYILVQNYDKQSFLGLKDIVDTKI